MIYLENTLSAQTVYIPRNEELVGNTPQPCSCELAPLNIVVTADTITDIRPEMGYDGYYSINIDATDYAQQNYDNGFDDGFEDGYASGSTEGYESGVTDGEQSIIDTFTSTTITINGQYGSSAHPLSSITVNVPQTGSSIPLSSITIIENTAITETEKAYSAITVNVPQTGHTDQELEDAYNSGHTDGENKVVESAIATAFTENGNYRTNYEYDGHLWDNVTVNVDTASTFNSGYTSGYTEGTEHGKDEVVSTFTSETITHNGIYGSSAHPYSSITVSVPQTGTSVSLEEKSVTVESDDTVVLPTSGYDGMSKVIIDASGFGNSKYESGYTSGYTSGFTSGYSSGFTSGETHQKSLLSSTSLTENGTYSVENGWSGVSVNVDTASTYNSGYTSGYTSGYSSGHTDGIDEQKALLSTTAITENGEYSRENGWSAITVNVPSGVSVSPKFVDTKGNGGNEFFVYQNGYFNNDRTHDYGETTITISKTDKVFSQDTNYYVGWVYDAFTQIMDTIFAIYYNTQEGFYIEEIKSGQSYTTASTTDEIVITLQDNHDSYYFYTNGLENDRISYVGIRVFPSTGYSQQDLDNAYLSGYTSGETHQKSLLSSTAFTANGSYLRLDGWNSVVVNVDTASTYQSGYTNGYASGMTDGYDSGYTSGYSSGYTSGFTDGYASGYTDGLNSGYEGGVETTIYGAYYPIESTQAYMPNRSYKTEITTFSGNDVTFDFDITYLIDSSKRYGMIINGDGDNLYLQYNSTDSADTTEYKLGIKDGNGNYSILGTYVRGYTNRIIGYVHITQNGCEYGIGEGYVITTGHTSGDFSNISYNVVFNSELKYNIVLNSMKVSVNGVLERAYGYKNGEIKELISDTTSTTYDYNGNVAVGALEPRFVNNPRKVIV